MLISPAEPPDPPEERSEHQQAATNQSERDRCCNRGATDVLLDHAERRQGIPKRGPDQKTQNTQDDKDREQHTRDSAQNCRERTECLTSREPEGQCTHGHRNPVPKHGINNLAIYRGWWLAERYKKEDCSENYERG